MKMLLIALVVLIVGAGVGYYLGAGKNKSTQLPPDVKSAEHAKPADVRVTVVGVWQSTDDAKFTREFRSDGTFADRYQNDASATAEGQWVVFVGPGNEPASVPLKKGITYVKLTYPEERAFFSLTKLTSDSLELVYLDRGGTLSFTKVR